MACKNKAKVMTYCYNSGFQLRNKFSCNFLFFEKINIPTEMIAYQGLYIRYLSLNLRAFQSINLRAFRSILFNNPTRGNSSNTFTPPLRCFGFAVRSATKL